MSWRLSWLKGYINDALPLVSHDSILLSYFPSAGPPSLSKRPRAIIRTWDLVIAENEHPFACWVWRWGMEVREQVDSLLFGVREGSN